MRLSLTALMATQLFAIGASFSRLPFVLYVLLAFLPFAVASMWEMGQGIYRWIKGAPLREMVQRWGLSLSRSGADFLLCAFEADIQLDAAVRGSIRTWFTQKQLMQWVTAEQAEKGDARTWIGYVRLMAPALLFDMLVIGFTYLQKPWLLLPTIAVCLCWTVSPLFANALDEKPPKPIPHAYAGRLRLLARQTEQFFTCFAGPQRHFLPPDHVDVQPGYGLRAADYTTPTNLGFALMAPLCAEQLGDLARPLAIRRIAQQITTIERLPHISGHLENWIRLDGQRTQAPFISTVDSANLCACLMVCTQALQEWKQPALAARTRALAQRMDFRVLYDEACGLFAIGLDGKTGVQTRSHYDLYASEARLASLIAVGRGEVPASHLRRLARPMTRVAGRPAMMSWNGTMFEYLLPTLFIRPQWRTVEAQMCTGVLRSQQKRVGRGRPFGASEAACGVFHPNEGYAYHAFGDVALQLNPQVYSGTVAPYASVLALEQHPHAVMQNLALFDRRHMVGRYGFFDAWAEREQEPVYTYMAHHQGMILAAVTNYLCHGCLQRWFGRNSAVAAAIPWLEETPSMPWKRESAASWFESLPKNEGIRRDQLKKREMYNIITN